MKVLLLSDANSIHTRRWALSLAANDIEVVVFSLSACDPSAYENVRVASAQLKVQKYGNVFSRLRYLFSIHLLKQLIKDFQPDILHAHYASSYGLLGALSGFHPFVLSVWGSDVYDFPNRNVLFRKVLEFNLAMADQILSTSCVMATKTQQYTRKPIAVTPFGVDTSFLKPDAIYRKESSIVAADELVIGTVKLIERVYGTEYLVDAFMLLVNKYPELPLRLLIVGKGSLQALLEQKVIELGIADRVIFTGPVPHNQVPLYHNLIDVFVALSDSESFGVSVVEAMACAKPVVVSDAEGLTEVVCDGETGFIVRKRDALGAANAIGKLLLDADLRKGMGEKGRSRAVELYNWNDNVVQMIDIYQKHLK